MTPEERKAWEYDGDLTGATKPSKYERQLQAAAQKLQAVLPIGQIKAVGLMEVASGIDALIAENARLAREVDRLMWCNDKAGDAEGGVIDGCMDANLGGF